MLGVNKRREVKTLLREHKPSAVARLTGVSLSSVKRIAKETDVCHVDDASERRRRRIGRPSKIRGFRWSDRRDPPPRPRTCVRSRSWRGCA